MKTTFFPTGHSLRARLVRALVPGAILLLFSIAVIWTFIELGNDRSREEQSISALGQIMAQQVARPLSQGAYVLMETALINVALPSYVESVRVYDQQNLRLVNVRNPSASQCSKLRPKSFEISGQNYFGSGETEGHLGRVELMVQTCDRFVRQAQFMAILLVALLAFTLGLSLLIPRVIDRSLRPLLTISNQELSRDRLDAALIETAPVEIKRLLLDLSAAYQKLSQAESFEEKSRIAKQVAHDIRSPLTALLAVEPSLGSLPETQRKLVKHAIQRIHEIAKDLLVSGQSQRSPVDDGSTPNASGTLEPSMGPGTLELLNPIIESLVTEKRVEYSQGTQVEIHFDGSLTSDAFCQISPSRFQRALSNLLNNAFEALPTSNGRIRIRTWTQRDQVVISIMDNGHGIPARLLKRIGSYEFSYKSSSQGTGHGLGVYSSRKAIESFGGQIEFRSQAQEEAEPGQMTGTEVTVMLPRAPTPSWFLPVLDLTKVSEVVLIDDDLEVHEIWRTKLESKQRLSGDLRLTTFTQFSDFESWLLTSGRTENQIFLVDYQIRGESENGLNVIQRLGLNSLSVLSTHHASDSAIQARCANLGVKLVAKSSVVSLPIVFGANPYPQESPNNNL